MEDVFDDFVRFMHPDADAIFDFSKGIEFLDKELEQLFPPEDDQYTPKIVDKLAKLYTHDGKEEWILIHLEVQGQYRKDFGSRMFRYYYRILDKYDRPITACAILTEASLVSRPDTYTQEYLGTRLSYKYNTYKIAEQDEAELLASKNPFALVVLTVKLAFAGKGIKDRVARDEQLFDLKLKLARELLSRDISKSKIRGLMIFLRFYVRFESSDISGKFEKEIEILTEKSETMGIEELMLDRAKKQGIKTGIKKGIETGIETGIKTGIEKGKKEGERKKAIEAAKKMKKSGFESSIISDIVGLSIEEVEKL